MANFITATQSCHCSHRSPVTILKQITTQSLRSDKTILSVETIYLARNYAEKWLNCRALLTPSIRNGKQTMRPPFNALQTMPGKNGKSASEGSGWRVPILVKMPYCAMIYNAFRFLSKRTGECQQQQQPKMATNFFFVCDGHGYMHQITKGFYLSFPFIRLCMAISWKVSGICVRDSARQNGKTPAGYV